MKKSTLGLAIVGGLAVLAAGSSWYVGKQLENHSQELIAGFTEEVEKTGMLSVKSIQLDRGWFSSELNYTLEVGDAGQINGNDRLYHGPFPLNRLMQLKLVPMLASGEHQLTAEGKIAESLKDGKFAELQTHLDFDGNLSDAVLSTQPITSPDGTLKVSEIHYQGNFTNFGKQHLKVPSMEITLSDGKIVVEDLEFESDFKRAEKYPLVQGVGKYQATIDGITFAQNQLPAITFADIKSQGDGDFKGERFFSEFDFASKLKRDNQEIGELRFGGKSEADNASWEKVTTLDVTQADPTQVFMELLAKGFRFDLSEFSFSNDKGKSQIAFDLVSKKVPLESLTNQTAILAALEGTKLDLLLNEPNIKALLTTFVTPAEAEQSYQQMKLGLTSTVAQAEGENVKLNLQIQDGKLHLNGRALSDGELQMLLMMIAMMGNG